MASEVGNKAKYCLSVGDIDFSSDSFKIILMDTGFSFNEDTDHQYSDVSGDELATGNGYTQDTKTLAGVSVTEDDTDDRVEITWNNVTWTASSGDIGPTPGAIIYDDTVTSSGTATTADPVIGFIDFGTTEITQEDGGTLTLKNIQLNIS